MQKGIPFPTPEAQFLLFLSPWESSQTISLLFAWDLRKQANILLVILSYLNTSWLRENLDSR